MTKEDYTITIKIENSKELSSYDFHEESKVVTMIAKKLAEGTGNKITVTTEFPERESPLF